MSDKPPVLRGRSVNGWVSNKGQLMRLCQYETECENHAAMEKTIHGGFVSENWLESPTNYLTVYREDGGAAKVVPMSRVLWVQTVFSLYSCNVANEAK